MGGTREALLPDGVVAPILTPFEADLSVSHRRMLAHAQSTLDAGCVGLAVFGTTGEALSVASREREAALEMLVDGGIDPGVVVVGTGLPDLPGTVRLTRHAVDLGCRACMVLPPFYFKDPSDEGLYRHFAGLIERVDDHRLRVVLYHIPQVAGVGIPAAVAARLRTEFPEQVVGLKDSSGDWATTEAFLDIDGLIVWPGAELPLLDALDRGSPGCITATANVNPGPVVEVVRRYGAGGRKAAADAMERARAYRLALQGQPAIPTMKRLLALAHDDPTWATVRPPFVEMDEAEGRILMDRLAAI
jgi:4-hydroxy-tetrahydrodipicolinate synthase